MVTVTGSTSCRGRRGGADGAPTSRRGGAGGGGSRGRRGGASRGRRGGADGGAALLVVLKHLNSRALDSTHHVLHDDVNFFFSVVMLCNTSSVSPIVSGRAAFVLSSIEDLASLSNFSTFDIASSAAFAATA